MSEEARGIKSLGARIIGSWELLAMGAGNSGPLVGCYS